MSYLTKELTISTANRGASASRWLHRNSFIAAWLGLLLAAITPPHGTGTTICFFKICTGIPCPGCGLTRSMSCALRGMFVESWQYHPLGIMILAMLLVLATISLLPRELRRGAARFIETHTSFFNAFHVLFVVVFVLFGAARAIAAIYFSR